MPGDLRRVVQPIDADGSGYINEFREMLKVAKEFAKANEELIRVVREAERAIGTAGDSGWRRLAVGMDEASQAIRRHNAMLDEARAANARFNESQVQTERLSKEGRQALSSLSDEYRRHRETVAQAQQAQAIFKDGLIDQANSTRDAVVAMSEHEHAVARLAKTYGTAQEAFAKSDFSAPLQYTAAHMETLKKTLRDTQAELDGTVRHVSALDSALAGGNISEAIGILRGTGGGGAALAAAAGAAGGGGGRGRWTAAQYAAAGGAGGPDFPAGSAGAQANAIVGFVKRWWGPVHWAMMATNEILATAGPAAAAAGAAALVGWQGVEQMRGRYQAITTAAESLGGAYGITAGSYLGTGSRLQAMQNLAAGGVYELGGAGINLARAGQGPFLQMGLNTIGMLDRGVAAMQVNMAQRGTMGTLAGLLGGGTDYLRTFGDIGANIGNIFLGLGPHLPGVGGDYLATLKGITGGLSGGIGFLNQHGMGDILGLGLAGEAGMRVGTPMVGLLGKLISSGGAGLARLGLGTGLGDAGLGIAGFGDALGMLGGPEVAALAMSAFLGSKLYSSMTPQASRQMAALQGQVNQAGFTGAWQPLAHAITTAHALSAAPGTPRGMQSEIGASQTIASAMRFGPQGMTVRDIYNQAGVGFAQQMGDLVGAGPQLVADLKKAGLKSVSMADAFQIAQNSLLDLSHAFDKHGNLTKVAQQQLQNYVSAIGPMTRSGGAFNAAVMGQQIMSSPKMQDLSKVNQAMDSMTQIMSGGPAGMATLFGMLGGTPTTITHGGRRLQAPALSAMAKALTSFTTPGGAAAWSTFAGSQGLIAAEQQNLDQLRTALTLGAIGQGGAAGLAGFQIQQMLPMARRSPAALAMLMQQGAQMGVTGYYDPSKSQAQNYQAAVAATAKIADNTRQANAAMNSMTVNLANIPAVAKQFVQGTGAQIQAQQVAKAAQDAMNIKGGINIKANVSDLVSQLKAAGVQGGAALRASLDAVLRQAGVGKAERIKIEADVSKAQAAIDGIHGKNVHVNVMSSGAQAAQAAIDRIHGKSVTVTVTTINRILTQLIGAHTLPGGPAPATLVGAGGTRIRAQTGGLVPGSGSGDIIPAMLEPGEAVIPRNLVPLIAPILTAHRVPGFGAPQSHSTHFAAGGLVPHVLGFADPGQASGHIGRNIAYTLIDGITTALKQAGAQKIATALIGKIAQEIQYARQVASQTRQGLNLAGMDPTQGPVTDQMASYLHSVQAFTGDIGALRKQHLNKNLIAQLLAAGPVQGDLLAQSILTGGGTSGSGVGQANSLWAQIGRASNALGAQAAMAQYGGHLSPNLGSAGAAVNHVTINVSGGRSGGLNLSPAEIKKLVEAVQAALLKQARRNNKTGLQLSGKGA